MIYTTVIIQVLDSQNTFDIVLLHVLEILGVHFQVIYLQNVIFTKFAAVLETLGKLIK